MLIAGLHNYHRESLVQKNLQELLCSQRWPLPPTPTASFECCGMEITQGDLNTLLPGRWLNDQVSKPYILHVDLCCSYLLIPYPSLHSYLSIPYRIASIPPPDSVVVSILYVPYCQSQSSVPLFLPPDSMP